MDNFVLTSFASFKIGKGSEQTLQTFSLVKPWFIIICSAVGARYLLLSNFKYDGFIEMVICVELLVWRALGKAVFQSFRMAFKRPKYTVNGGLIEILLLNLLDRESLRPYQAGP